MTDQLHRDTDDPDADERESEREPETTRPPRPSQAEGDR